MERELRKLTTTTMTFHTNSCRKNVALLRTANKHDELTNDNAAQHLANKHCSWHEPAVVVPAALQNRPPTVREEAAR